MPSESKSVCPECHRMAVVGTSRGHAIDCHQGNAVNSVPATPADILELQVAHDEDCWKLSAWFHTKDEAEIAADRVRGYATRPAEVSTEEMLRATRQVLAEYPGDEALQIQARAIDRLLATVASTPAGPLSKERREKAQRDAPIWKGTPADKCVKCGCEFVKANGEVFTVNLDCTCSCHQNNQG